MSVAEYSDRFGDGGLNHLVEECDIDAEEIEWRKEFIGFDEDNSRRLAGCRTASKPTPARSPRTSTTT
jgi:hypothetical protein